MINREIIYERDIYKSYMKIPAVSETCLDEKLIFGKAYQGILPMEKCFINGNGQYWYNISGKQALDVYCKVNSINQGFFKRLILKVCSQLEILEWNLIDTSCLVMDPELIFLNHNGEEISFVLYPETGGNIFDELQQLMEYLLTKLNHGDKEGVHEVYRIYEMVSTKGYSISDLKKVVLEESVQRDAEEIFSKQEVNEYGEVLNKKLKKDMKENTETHQTEIHQVDIFEEIENKLQMLIEKAKAILWKKDNREQIPMVIGPGDEPEEEEMIVHPTICLAANLGEPQGLLLYEGIGDYPDFDLEQDSNIVGKNPRVKIYINRDTISQFHAKIDYFDKTYYIEDMNSTNGTFVNDELLNYKERKELSSGDVVRFADVKYRFL